MLQHGRLMLEFEALKSLFSFLNVLMNPKNHSSDSIGWVMAKCLHKQMIKKMREVVTCLKYFALSCDEVTVIDN
jgi:hypothetical protein